MHAPSRKYSMISTGDRNLAKTLLLDTNEDQKVVYLYCHQMEQLEIKVFAVCQTCHLNMELLKPDTLLGRFLLIFL